MQRTYLKAMEDRHKRELKNNSYSVILSRIYKIMEYAYEISSKGANDPDEYVKTEEYKNGVINKKNECQKLFDLWNLNVFVISNKFYRCFDKLLNESLDGESYAPISTELRTYEMFQKAHNDLYKIADEEINGSA